MKSHTLEDEMTGIEAQSDPEFAKEAECYKTEYYIFDNEW